MDIVSLKEEANSPVLTEFRNLLENEWGKFAPFEQEKLGIASPPPLVAIEQNELLGGLAFSLWPHPGSNSIAIWINGLLVKPEYRNRRIATKLVKEAMLQEKLIFVVTEYPRLYKNLGWSELSKNEKGVVLTYRNTD